MKKLLAIDRDDFVKATDDYNSVHFGPEGLAHGCHVLGWAVGQLVEDGDVVTALDVQFRYPIPVGSSIEVWVQGAEGLCTHAAISAGDVKKAVVFRMWRKEHAQAPGD